MSTINTKDLVKLRKATGAGLMDCKKALIEAKGNFEEAIDIIRKKGAAIANKRADRVAGEGVVLAKSIDDNKSAAMICLNCETDFVAKNKRFVEFANKILNKALTTKPSNLDELKSKILDDNRSIQDHIAEQTGIIGEKIDLSYYELIEAPFTITYIHMGNKLSTMIGFNKVTEKQVAKDIAMQTAAMAPIAIDKNDVPQNIIDKELEIGKEKARLEGKPVQILEKIAKGRLGKFLQENTLLNQNFIKNNKISVKQYLLQSSANIKITHMKRYSLSD